MRDFYEAQSGADELSSLRYANLSQITLRRESRESMEDADEMAFVQMRGVPAGLSAGSANDMLVAYDPL